MKVRDKIKFTAYGEVAKTNGKIAILTINVRLGTDNVIISEEDYDKAIKKLEEEK